MSSVLTWHVGNRNPSITETITSNGVPVDLTAATVRFRMRAFNSTTLKVDQPATIVTPAAGTVRYDWAAADVDTDGYFLVWWQVTIGGKTQDMGEAVIEFRAHAPELNAYVELEELKSTAELTGTNFADQDIQTVLVAASRGIDEAFHRRYWKDADDTQVRYYTPNGACTLEIDDLIDLTSVTNDADGDGTFEETWVLNTDFTLEPLNAAADARPWETIRLHPNSSFRFSRYPRSLKVTGQFGWPAVPAEVKTATTIIATRLLLRARQAPFGVVSAGMEGDAIRIARFDSDLDFLRNAVGRSQVLA
jgi:hypothetical protein